MNSEQLIAVERFIKKVPQDEFLELSKIEKASLFLWFSTKALGHKSCSWQDIEACFLKLSLHDKLPELKYRLRFSSEVVFKEPDRFALERSSLLRYTKAYSKYLG